MPSAAEVTKQPQTPLRASLPEMHAEAVGSVRPPANPVLLVLQERADPVLAIAGLFSLINVLGFFLQSQRHPQVGVPPAEFLMGGALTVFGIALAIAGSPIRQRVQEWREDPWAVAQLTALALLIAAALSSIPSGIHTIAPTMITATGVLGAVLLTWWVSASAAVRAHLPFQGVVPLLDRPLRTAVAGGQGSALRERASELVVGDEIRCSTGDLIPVDGEIVEGRAFLQERRWSGRTVGRIRLPGQRVSAGSVVVSGDLLIRVANTVEDTVYGYFLGMRDRALPPRADSLQRSTTVIALSAVLSGFAVLFWRDRGLVWSNALAIGSSMLLLTVLGEFWRSVEWSVRTQIHRAFEHGVLLRSVEALHRLVGARDWLFWLPSAGRSQVQLIEFELLDGRCEEGGVREAVAAVATASECPWSEALGSLLPVGFRSPRVTQVGEGVWYSKYPGLIGSVDGVELSIGPEAFMIDRGIPIQGSDLGVAEEGELVLLVAIDSEVVARVIVREIADPSLPKAVQVLRTLHRTVTLLGPDPAPVLEQKGKALGFEAVEIRSEVAASQLKAHIAHPGESVLVATSGMDRTLLGEDRFIVAPFNPLLWELEGADLTILEGGARAVTELLRDSRRNQILAALARGAAYGLTGILLFLSLVGLISPLVMAVSVLAATLAFSLIVDLQRISNRPPDAAPSVLQ